MTLSLPAFSFGALGGKVAGAGNLVPLLANVGTAPIAAYGLTKLIASYAGPAIRVQRASDNAQQDIGFTSAGALDTNAATTFANGSGLTAVTRYDQTGNGFHQTGGTGALLLGNPGGPEILNGTFVMPVMPSVDRAALTIALALRESNSLNSPPVLGWGNNSNLDLEILGFLGGYNEQVAYDNYNQPVSPVDGRAEVTSSPCTLVWVSSGSLCRDANTHTFTAPSSKTLAAGGTYNPGSNGNASAPHSAYAMVMYPAALSAPNVSTVRKSLQSIYNTNADSGVPTISMIGDSKVVGAAADVGASGLNITRLLADAYGVGKAKVHNYGLSGSSVNGGSYVSVPQPDAGDSANVMVIGFGTNNLVTQGDSAATIFGYLQQNVAGARANRGVTKTVMLTVTPRSGISAAQAAQLTALNAMIKANPGSLFDAIADYTAISQLGSYPTSPNTAYLPDGLHENLAGLQLEAPVLKAAVDAAIAAASKPSCTTNPTLSASTATVGTAITCNTGTWANSPTTYVYAWSYADTGAAISGATSSSYTPVAADVGHTLTCSVTATNAAGTSNASLPAAATSAVASAAATGSLLLDKLSATAKAAYSMRQVRSAYSGVAANLLNETNNATATVAYDTSVSPPSITPNSVVTITGAGSTSYTVGQMMALSAFYASSAVSITKLPDQTGNGYDWVTTGRGPFIAYNGGLQYTNSSLPGSTQFSFANVNGERKFGSGGFPSGAANNTRSIYGMMTRGNTNHGQPLYTSGGSGFALLMPSGQIEVVLDGSVKAAVNTAMTIYKQQTWAAKISPSNIAFLLDGAANGGATGTFSWSNPGPCSPQTGTDTEESYHGEFLIFDGTALSASDESAIQASQKAQWGTT